MFDIGWSELLVIGVVALIAIGPKELPAVLRTAGQWMGKIRRMAAEFQGQFQEAMREAELSDIKKHVDEMSSAAHNITNFDPLAEARHDIESVTGDLTTLEQKPAATTPTTEPAAEAPAVPAAELAPAASPPTSDPAPAAPAVSPETATAASGETPPKPVERP